MLHHRRNFLRIGSLATVTGGMPWFGQQPATGFQNPEKKAGKKCILIWLDGGPSHLEMFDPKPDAPTEVRGPFGTAQTPLAGIRFSEFMPQLAKRLTDFSVIRSMTSPLGEHNLGTHYLLSGYKPTPVLDYPAFGTVFTHLAGNQAALPPNIAIPHHRVGGSNFSPSGFLGNSKRPFEVGADPSKKEFRVNDLDWYPSLNEARIRQREAFLNGIEELADHGNAPLDTQFGQAFNLLRSAKAKKAFDITAESNQTRNRYGLRSIGQCCLMARRLVEHGVQFVTVNNTGWDTHDKMVTRLRDGYNGAKIPVGLIPSLDIAVSSLIDDLKDRGLYDETLIVVMGEFGRTPKLNVTAGRDHWPRVFSVMLGGGGIKAGTIYGKSDAKGESPLSNPVNPGELIATIYKILGIDPAMKLRSPGNRPIALSNGQDPIADLI